MKERSSFYQPGNNHDAIIIVPGRAVDSTKADYKTALKERTERAHMAEVVAKHYCNPIIILSGYNGEALALLQLIGLSENTTVLLENQATHTLENMHFSYNLLQEKGFDTSLPVIICTNAYHAPRAFLSAKRFFKNVQLSTSIMQIVFNTKKFWKTGELQKCLKYQRGSLWPGVRITALLADILPTKNVK